MDCSEAAPSSGSGLSGWSQAIGKPNLVHSENPLPELGASVNNSLDLPKLINQSQCQNKIEGAAKYSKSIEPKIT